MYTDGSSLGNPGPGGFCAIIKAGGSSSSTSSTRVDKKIIVKGGADETTNNRMEMSAVIAGLHSIYKHFPREREVHIFSDSSLIIDTMNKGWKRKKNTDLWEKLDRIVEKFDDISWNWVRGHNGHVENTEADKIAVQESTKRKMALHRN